MLKSARAQAGKVKRKKGNEAAVAISDTSSGEALDVFMSQVAADVVSSHANARDHAG